MERNGGVMIDPSEFEQRRSPSALREFVHARSEAIRANPDARELGTLKKGAYKKYVEELVPLSCFAVLAYPDSYEVQLVLGNQGFDARVFDEVGREVDRVEITTPHDGPAASQDPALVVEKGFGKVSVTTPRDAPLGRDPSDHTPRARQAQEHSLLKPRERKSPRRSPENGRMDTHGSGAESGCRGGVPPQRSPHRLRRARTEPDVERRCLDCEHPRLQKRPSRGRGVVDYPGLGPKTDSGVPRDRSVPTPRLPPTSVRARSPGSREPRAKKNP